MSFDHSFAFEGGRRNPVILDVISYKQSKPSIWEIVFDGYWYLEPETFPVKRVLQYHPNPTLCVEVLERTTINDHPIEGTEDDPTFFPNARIKIVYKVLYEVKTPQDMERMKTAMSDSDEEERDATYRAVREAKENEEHIRFCKTLDYSSYKTNSTEP